MEHQKRLVGEKPKIEPGDEDFLGIWSDSAEGKQVLIFNIIFLSSPAYLLMEFLGRGIRREGGTAKSKQDNFQSNEEDTCQAPWTNEIRSRLIEGSFLLLKMN